MPFFVLASNYSCLPDLKSQIDLLGRVPGTSEGAFEKYIQYLKRELAGTRHTPDFLLTLLTKLLKTFFIEIVNETNSMHQEKEYARTSRMKLLKGQEEVETVLDNNDALSGIVGDYGEIYLLQKAGVVGGKGYNMIQLDFDD